MLSPPASTALCHYGCVALGTQHIHHEGVRRQDTSLQHGEDARVAARHQCDALIIDLYGLLLIPACHIPEQRVAVHTRSWSKNNLRYSSQTPYQR